MRGTHFTPDRARALVFAICLVCGCLALDDAIQQHKQSRQCVCVPLLKTDSPWRSAGQHINSAGKLGRKHPTPPHGHGGS